MSGGMRSRLPKIRAKEKNTLHKDQSRYLPRNNQTFMRIVFSILAVAVAVLSTGCAGPEAKLGRGLNNVTELVRGGEFRRSMEQTGLWDGPGMVGTTGFLRGFNRTMARTGIGVYEIVTSPIPPWTPVAAPEFKTYPDFSITTTKFPYGGLQLPVNPVSADSYKRGFSGGGLFDTDNALGFTGGESLPFPGSRFRIFDN